MEEQKYLTLDETAQFLRLSIRTLYQMVYDGKIPVLKFGKKWIFDKQAIENWVNEHHYKSQKIKILVVDDEEPILEAICNTITSQIENAEIQTAMDGKPALIIVGRFNPSIIILDIMLPEEDGFKVCRTLREDPVTKDICIIAMSGSLDDDIEERILKEGADAFLRKPFPVDKIVEIIAEKCLSGKILLKK